MGRGMADRYYDNDEDDRRPIGDPIFPIVSEDEDNEFTLEEVYDQKGEIPFPKYPNKSKE